MTAMDRRRPRSRTALLTIFAIAGTLCGCGVYGSPIRSAPEANAAANPTTASDSSAGAAGPADESASEGWPQKERIGTGIDYQYEFEEPDDADAAEDAETWSDEP
jgi:hypothetical protein